MSFENNRKIECLDNITWEDLIKAQNAVNNNKWKLKSISLPKDCKIEETEEYKSIEIEYIPVPQEKIKTEIVKIQTGRESNENKRHFPYEYFNMIQSLVLDSVYNTRESTLIAAPTGSGKTELAILSIFKEYSMFKEKSFIVYLAPTKSLIKQIETTLKNRVGHILTVEQDTTDTHRKSKELWAYGMNILVTTPERYDILLLKKRICPTLLIVDEIHILGESRGGVLESVIVRSKPFKNMRILGISATIPNYRDVAEFIGAKREHSYYFGYSYKEIPMTYKIVGIKKNKHCLQALKFCSCLQKKSPTLIFINSKKECHAIARLLSSKDDAGCIRENENDKTSAILSHLSCIAPVDSKEKDEFMHEVCDEMEILRNGIGVHHSGMSKNVKAAVESLFREGFIKIICCTSTLSCGVNLPADNVIVYKTKAAGCSYKDSYALSEISQMCGRSGRKGLSVRGTVTIITEVDKIAEYSRAVTFQFPIESRLADTLHIRMLYEINLGKTSVESLTCWLKETYAYKRGVKHKELQKYFAKAEQLVISVLKYLISIESISVQNKTALYANEKHQNLSRPAIETAQDITLKTSADLLNTQPAQELVARSSFLGKVSFKYYLDPTTAYRMHKILKKVCLHELDLDVGDILLIISTAEDYKQISDLNTKLPSTDKVFSRLQNTLKYPIRSKDCKIRKIIESEAEVKEIFSVLVQAHISRIEIDRVFYSIYSNLIVGVERIVWALFALGQTLLNRSIFSVLDLAKSIKEREWKYCREREALPVTIEVDKTTLVLLNPHKHEIFLTISSPGEYKAAHTACIKKNKYCYSFPEASNSTSYKIQIDGMHRFTRSVVEYIQI